MKEIQVNKISKTKQLRNEWTPKIQQFLEANSRVMPNKDTILINGEHVAKRHLLTSKFEAYRSFKKANTDFPKEVHNFF